VERTPLEQVEASPNDMIKMDDIKAKRIKSKALKPLKA